jgi:hypothetical protein
VLNCAVPNLPRAHLVPLQELALRILETRAVEGDPSVLAKELLAGFYDVCQRYGLDGTLDALGLTNEAALSDHPELREALAVRLGNKAEFDPRGPRNAKPKQLADCLVATLGLTLTDEEHPTITLEDDVRKAVAGALGGVIESELAVPKIREDIIQRARARIQEQHLSSFEKISAQLDERGMRMVRQPKVPLDAQQAINELLFEARNVVIEKAGNAAIDRAKAVLAKSNAEAAERIDQPITLKLTPRQVAIRRVADSRVSKVPSAVIHTLLESITELARIAWRSLEKPVREYSAGQTYTVGELIQHPKFGKGEVTGVAIQRIDVEFPEGKYTLVHARK